MMIPVNAVLSRKGKKLSRALMTYVSLHYTLRRRAPYPLNCMVILFWVHSVKDKRIKITTEALQAIKIIKLYDIRHTTIITNTCACYE